MEILNDILQKNRFAVDNLFRSYKVCGSSDLDKIHNGYQSHGEAFMMKLLSIITPEGQNSNFDNTLLESKLPDPYVVPLVTSSATPSATAVPGKGWTFWKNFLGALSSTGKAVGGVISDIKTPIAATDPVLVQQQAATAATEAKTTNTLYIFAGVFVAVILIILITKK